MLTTTHPQGAAQGRSQMVIPKPEKIDIDFTDAKLTGMAGSLFVARLANELKLPDLLKEQIRLKKRDRGCDDKDSLLGLIHNFCGGNGKLSDMDALRADKPTVNLLGLPDIKALAFYRAGAFLYLRPVIKGICTFSWRPVQKQATSFFQYYLSYLLYSLKVLLFFRSSDPQLFFFCYLNKIQDLRMINI